MYNFIYYDPGFYRSFYLERTILLNKLHAKLSNNEEVGIRITIKQWILIQEIYLNEINISKQMRL